MRKWFRIFLIVPRSILVSAILSLVAFSAAGQEIGRNAGEVKAQPATKANSEVEEKLKTLEYELREQAKRLEEMRALVADQQRTIQSLQAKETISEKKLPDQKEIAAAPSSPATETQAPPLEDRVKKLESKVLAVGPFRFSGDFRLRFDGIFRKADPAPPTGFSALTHQQNARMRYRLRLNFDTDINSKTGFHGQLATGPINNALTMDQDFGETTARHPFFISEAWVDYHPRKSIQLQAGRLQEIFADNSRFLFDDDIRFNGFNEKYTVSFKNKGLKLSSLELRAGQYILSNPNVAIVTSGSPLAQAGAVIGSTGRNSNLFHQGHLLNQKYNDRWTSQFGGDIQLYRNPNQK